MLVKKISSIANKVTNDINAIIPTSPGNTLYGAPGLDDESIKNTTIRLIVSGIIIPIIFVIGLVLYNRKSKSKAMTKAIVTILMLFVCVAVMLFVMSLK